jgi:hypothetical protein
MVPDPRQLVPSAPPIRVVIEVGHPDDTFEVLAADAAAWASLWIDLRAMALRELAGEPEPREPE